MSVYGTGMAYTIAAFLDGYSTLFATYVRSPSRDGLVRKGFSSYAAAPLGPGSVPGSRFLSVSPQF